MSSVYRILCVSHDPALIVTSEDWNGSLPALDAIRDRTSGPAAAHPNCDLVVGRYSVPLIEVCCPASRSNGLYHGSSHRDDEWIVASWLRLLALSKPEVYGMARLRSCWTPELARALRVELDVEVAE
jgi:hypothetical protein